MADRIVPVPAEPPAAALHAMIAMYRLSQAVHVAAELGIADLLVDGPQTSEQLAVATNTHAPSLTRVLQLLSRVGVFALDANERWCLTPRAELLRSDVPDSLRAVARLLGSPSSWEPWADLVHSVRTGEAAFRHRYGMDRFAHLAAHPELSTVFNAAMAGLTAAEIAAVTDYDFAGIGTLVDVGGGKGATLAAVLQDNPGMHAVLFDLPHVVAEAGPVLEAAGVADRCQVVAGNFFEGVPTGGDAYLLKHVVHNWPDIDAGTILSRCREAMDAHGALLVVEQVVDPHERGFDPLDFDLHMLVMLGSRERTAVEYAELLATAGFRLERIVTTEAPVQIIQAVPL
jgi:hypothetical protein